MKSEIKIEVDGGALGDLVVCGMTLREGLSEPYRAEVTAFSEQPRTPAKLRDEALGRRVSLRIVQNVEKEGTVTRYLCGIVTSVAHLGAKIQDAEIVSFCGTQKRRLSSYRLVIEPQLAQLAFTRRTLDYPDTTPLGVVKQVLSRNSIAFDAGQYLDPEEYSGKVRFVQRDETDLAFIHRVMARYGISYTFTHAAKGAEQMVLSSGNDYPVPSALAFQGLEGFSDGKEQAFSTEGFGRGAFKLTGFCAESRTGFTGLKDGFLRPAQTKGVEKEAGDTGTARVWLRNEAPAGYGEDVDDTTLDKDFARFADATKTAMRLAGDDWRGETPHIAAMPGKVLRITGFVDGEEGADEPVKARVTHADLAIDLLKRDDEVFRLAFAAQDFSDDLQEKRWVSSSRFQVSGFRIQDSGFRLQDSGLQEFNCQLGLIEAVVCDRSGKIDDENTLNTIVTSPHSTAEMPWVFLVRNPNPGKDDEGANKVIDVAMTMPLGGKRAGLYHFPRVGERVFVMLTGDRAVLMGYVPDKTGSFSDFPEGGDKWARKATSLRYTPPTGEKTANGGYAEIGFAHVSGAAEAIAHRIVEGTLCEYLQSLAIDANDIVAFNEIAGYYMPKANAARERYFSNPGAEAVAGVRELAEEIVKNYSLTGADGKEGVALRLNSTGSIMQHADGDIEISTPGTLRINAAKVEISGAAALQLQSEGKVQAAVGASSMTVNGYGAVMRARRLLDAPSEYDSSVVVGATDGVSVSGSNVRLHGLFHATMSDAMGAAVIATGGELMQSGAIVDLATVPRGKITEAFEKLSRTSGVDKMNEVLSAWQGGSTPDGSGVRSIADRAVGTVGLTCQSSKNGDLPTGNFRGTMSMATLASADLTDLDGAAGSKAGLDSSFHRKMPSAANPALTITQGEMLRAKAFIEQMGTHRKTVETVAGSTIDGQSASVTLRSQQLDLNVQTLNDLTGRKQSDGCDAAGSM